MAKLGTVFRTGLFVALAATAVETKSQTFNPSTPALGVIDINSQNYEIYNISGSPTDLIFKSTPWYTGDSNNSTTAKQASEAWTSTPGFGLKFLYNGYPCGFQGTEDCGQYFEFGRDGFEQLTNLSSYAFARQVQIQAILISGNTTTGNGINTSSNLGQSISPEFKGGTLTVDQNNSSISQDFTLDSSATNSIDANGNEASFSGVFSDAASGTPGNIRFENSVVGNNKTITLTGNSSYTGNTSIGPRVFLALRGTGSINNSSDLTIERGGRLNIETNAGTSHTLRNVTGGGDLQPNSGATVEINRSGVRFDGRLQTIPGSVTKTGTESWTLTNPDSHVHGGVTVAEGAWIMDGGSFDGKAPWTPVTVLPGARFAVTSGTTTNTGTFTVGGAGNRSHLEINGNLRVNGHLNLEPRSRVLFNWNDGTSGTRARELHVGGTLNHNGESIDSRGGDYYITVNSLQGKSNILVDGEKLTLTTRNDSPFDGKIGDFNPGQQGGTLIKSGQGTLSLSQSGGITNLNNVQVNEGTLALLNGGNTVNTATTISPGAALKLSNSSSSLTSTTVDVNAGGLLTGNGTIVGNVTNNGAVKPGGSGAIGTLTVDGDFTQNSSGSLEIEIDVASHSNDLLKITGANRSLDLDGTLAISTLNGQTITPNVPYTAVTAPKGTSENISITSNFSGVAVNSGFVFVRESNPAYANLDQNYYDACKNDQANCTDVRFGWLQRTPSSKTPNKGPSHIKPVAVAQTTAPVLTATKLPGKQTIQQVKQTGGALTTAISGQSGTNTAICTANTNNSKTCKSANKKGTGSSGHNTNNVNIAQKIDAGKTSTWVGLKPAIVSHPSTGSTQVITPNSKQKQTLVTKTKPTITPHKESNGHVVQIKTGGQSKQTQTIVVTKKPTIVKNPDGTHTTTFHPSGGRSIKNAHGHETGINTEQAKVAGVTPDFIKVANSLLSIPTRQELNRALHAISAEPYASMQSVALEAIEQFGKNSLAFRDRAVPLSESVQICQRDDGSRIPAADLDPSEECKLRTIKRPQRWTLMVDAANAEASLDGTNDLASFDYDIFSTIVGLQYAINPQWSVGGSLGYGRANLSNYEYANSTIESDTYAGSLWGTYKPNPDWRITGQLGLMGLDYNSTRSINLPGINRVAEADWNGTAWLATLATDYTWALGDNKDNPNAIKLRPNLFITYANHHQGRFSETGADSLNLELHSHTADSLLAGLGMELELPIVLNASNRLIPRFFVGYEHDFMGDTNQEHELKSEFAKLPALGSVDVLGQNRGSDDLDLALSIELETSDSISIFGNIGGSFWSNGSELSYGGGVRVLW